MQLYQVREQSGAMVLDTRGYRFTRSFRIIKQHKELGWMHYWTVGYVLYRQHRDTRAVSCASVLVAIIRHLHFSIQGVLPQ